MAFELRESFYGSTAKIDREAGLIRDVKFLGLASPSKNRVYTDDAIAKALPLYEGKPVNLDHVTDAKHGRSVRDRIGIIVNCRHRPGDGGYADLKINPKHPLAESILWFAENSPSAIGMSHIGFGKGRVEKGRQIIESIERVQSVDIVGDPATTNGLFESRSSEMEFDAIKLEDLKANRPDLVESILAESKASGKTEALLAENKAMKAELETLKAKDALAAKRAKALELCESAKLSKEAVSEDFLAVLLESKDEEHMTRLVKDRASLIATFAGKPRSTEQRLTESEHYDDDDKADFKSAKRMYAS